MKKMSLVVLALCLVAGNLAAMDLDRTMLNRMFTLFGRISGVNISLMKELAAGQDTFEKKANLLLDMFGEALTININALKEEYASLAEQSGISVEYRNQVDFVLDRIDEILDRQRENVARQYEEQIRQTREAQEALLRKKRAETEEELKGMARALGVEWKGLLEISQGLQGDPKRRYDFIQEMLEQRAKQIATVAEAQRIPTTTTTTITTGDPPPPPPPIPGPLPRRRIPLVREVTTAQPTASELATRLVQSLEGLPEQAQEDIIRRAQDSIEQIKSLQEAKERIVSRIVRTSGAERTEKEKIIRDGLDLFWEVSTNVQKGFLRNLSEIACKALGYAQNPSEVNIMLSKITVATFPRDAWGSLTKKEIDRGVTRDKKAEDLAKELLRARVLPR